MNIEFEELTHQNFLDACQIDRDDIPEDFVDTASTIMNITDYGLNHHCIGHTFVVKYNEKPIGLILSDSRLVLSHADSALSLPTASAESAGNSGSGSVLSWSQNAAFWPLY